MRSRVPLLRAVSKLQNMTACRWQIERMIADGTSSSPFTMSETVSLFRMLSLEEACLVSQITDYLDHETELPDLSLGSEMSPYDAFCLVEGGAAHAIGFGGKLLEDDATLDSERGPTFGLSMADTKEILERVRASQILLTEELRKCVHCADHGSHLDVRYLRTDTPLDRDQFFILRLLHEFATSRFTSGSIGHCLDTRGDRFDGLSLELTKTLVDLMRQGDRTLASNLGAYARGEAEFSDVDHACTPSEAVSLCQTARQTRSELAGFIACRGSYGGLSLFRPSAAQALLAEIVVAEQDLFSRLRAVVGDVARSEPPQPDGRSQSG
jgi:hypothetical protein